MLEKELNIIFHKLFHFSWLKTALIIKMCKSIQLSRDSMTDHLECPSSWEHC